MGWLVWPIAPRTPRSLAVLTGSAITGTSPACARQDGLAPLAPDRRPAQMIVPTQRIRFVESATSRPGCVAVRQAGEGRTAARKPARMVARVTVSVTPSWALASATPDSRDQIARLLLVLATAMGMESAIPSQALVHATRTSLAETAKSGIALSMTATDEECAMTPRVNVCATTHLVVSRAKSDSAQASPLAAAGMVAVTTSMEHASVPLPTSDLTVARRNVKATVVETCAEEIVISALGSVAVSQVSLAPNVS